MTSYLREKAARCRRLADMLANRADPAIVELLRMADEIEGQALNTMGLNDGGSVRQSASRYPEYAQKKSPVEAGPNKINRGESLAWVTRRQSN